MPFLVRFLGDFCISQRELLGIFLIFLVRFFSRCFFPEMLRILAGSGCLSADFGCPVIDFRTFWGEFLGVFSAIFAWIFFFGVLS